MLRLNLAPGPRWIDLALGVRVEVLPMGTTILRNAYADVAERHEDIGDAVVLAKAIGARASVAWEGVGGEDGDPVELTPEGFRALMEVPVLFAAFQRAYVTPGFEAMAEGNGSGASPNGTSEGAPNTAGTAKESAQSARLESTRHVQ